LPPLFEAKVYCFAETKRHLWCQPSCSAKLLTKLKRNNILSELDSKGGISDSSRLNQKRREKRKVTVRGVDSRIETD